MDCVVYLHGDMTFLQVSLCSIKDPIFLKVRMDVQTNVNLSMIYVCVCVCMNCCSGQVQFELHASARLCLQENQTQHSTDVMSHVVQNTLTEKPFWQATWLQHFSDGTFNNYASNKTGLSTAQTSCYIAPRQVTDGCIAEVPLSTMATAQNHKEILAQPLYYLHSLTSNTAMQVFGAGGSGHILCLEIPVGSVEVVWPVKLGASMSMCGANILFSPTTC